MSDEYRAMVDAGFILQIDDPGIATSWDMIKPEPTLAEYRKYLKLRIDALNHALNGIPPRIACATISAGAAGMARIPTTCR